MMANESERNGWSSKNSMRQLMAFFSEGEEMRKPGIIAVVLLCICQSLLLADGEPVEIRLGASLDAGYDRYRETLWADAINAGLVARNEFFTFITDFSFVNDGKYPSHNAYELGHYFDMKECTISVNWQGLTLKGGRERLDDAVDSPYALFMSSCAIPPLHIDLEWQTERFSYLSRWVQLNKDSDVNYEGVDLSLLDRGMNYKEYVLKLGALRLGYQDANVYLYEDLNVEAFINPLPQYVQQMILYSSDRPYSRFSNPNSLMGFFGDYADAPFKVNAQILVDDINASFLAPVLGGIIPALKNINNVSKLAWAIGGSCLTDFGEFGFFHAGATKYAFESTYTRISNPDLTTTGLYELGPDYDILPYGYAYFPLTTYTKGGVERTVDYTDNYIGFKYGENALAFLVAYRNDFFDASPYSFSLDSSLEYVINGSKSPANPWHEYDSWLQVGKAVALLDDAVSEHGVMLSANARKMWGKWDFSLKASLGYVWNKLVPTPVEGRPLEAKVWRPTAGNDAPVAAIGIGVAYRI
jgi:hypothetical protein